MKAFRNLLEPSPLIVTPPFTMGLRVLYLFNYPALVHSDYDYLVLKKCEERNVKNLYEEFLAFLIIFWVRFFLFMIYLYFKSI